MAPKLLIGLTSSTAIALLTFMGYGIVNNDIRSTAEHIEIRREQVAGDYRVYEKIDKVEDLATDIRLEQTEQRMLLQGIAGKL